MLRRPPGITMLGLLNFIGGGFYLLFAAFGLIASVTGDPSAIVVAIIAGGIGGLLVACGYGLWTLKSFGRTIQLVLAWIGLLGFPFVTIISILILVYLYKPGIKIVFSGKSAAELSPQELSLVAQTRSSLMVAVLILSGVAFFVFTLGAIAIPGLLTNIDHSKKLRTMADMRSIATAIEFYAEDNEIYPLAADVFELQSMVAPTYIRSMPTTDGWGQTLRIRSGQKEYVIKSPGKDGIFQDGAAAAATSRHDADIVLTNGQFVEQLEGIE